MNYSNTIAVISAFLLIFCQACGGDDPGLLPTLSDGLPESCNGVTDVFEVANIDGRTEHPCFAWVNRVYGRSAKGGGGGSAAIWSIDTGNRTALVVSAAHVIKGFSEDQSGFESPDTFYNPQTVAGFSFVRLTDPATYRASDAFSASFIFYHPYIPAEVVSADYSNIMPGEDFFVLLIDSQLLENKNGVAQIAEPIRMESPAFYDPGNLAGTQPTFASVKTGDLLLLMGYPSAENGKLFASTVQVLSDSEAETALDALKHAGDEEGFIPYDRNAEVIVRGHAEIGMSGGGAFDMEGRLVGITIRKSLANVKVPIVRIVRMDYVVSNMHETLENLTEETQTAIIPFLDRSLLN